MTKLLRFTVAALAALTLLLGGSTTASANSPIKGTWSELRTIDVELSQMSDQPGEYARAQKLLNQRRLVVKRGRAAGKAMKQMSELSGVSVVDKAANRIERLNR
jgi:hypothetical protein